MATLCGMADERDIDELLDGLLFDQVEELIDQADPEAKNELRDRLTQRRQEAEERARALFDEISGLRSSSQRAELVEIALDPLTRRLLALLPDTPRRHAEMRLEEAELWAANRRKTNERRLEEARRALSGLDLELARGLMKRIDGRFLTDEQEAERDQLLLDISARTIELESLSEEGNELIEEDEDDEPWWRRWRS